jgi:UTP:GlnB (protein PII) uridylyltransferase
VFYTPQVLNVLVCDRQRSIARDLAFARQLRLRRRLAALVYALGAGLTTLGAVLDEPGTVKA